MVVDIVARGVGGVDCQENVKSLVMWDTGLAAMAVVCDITFTGAMESQPPKEATMTRTDIQTSFADTIKSLIGAEVEVTISESKARGMFVSICADIAALDAVRPVMSKVGNVRFSDRSIDPDDDMQIDFYTVI